MFIVLEGIDGAGKGHQRNELVSLLADEVENVTTADFPDHNSAIYEHLIHPALHEEIEVSPQGMFLSFVLDQVLWQKKISPSLGSKTNFFIADGYYTTTLVYQCLMNKTISVKKALQYAKDFEIAVPDLVVYLDVDPEIAMERKMHEEGHDEGLDIYERSLKKQKKIRQGFQQMVKDQSFGKWVQVDGSGTIEEVGGNIVEALRKNKIF